MRCLVVLAFAACAEPTTTTPSSTRVVEAASFPAVPQTALDLVFQLDNSGSTAHLQIDLVAALGALLPRLEGIDLHIGVTTSDLGTTGSASSEPGAPVGTVGQGGCAGLGDGGVFETAAPVNGGFVVHGPSGRNHEGTLADVLGTLMRVGSTGCGFEQPLAATRRALVVNEGFLRSDASLAIVILADEDDCSIRDVGFLGPDVEGPLTSFRCTTQGVVCDEQLSESSPKTHCRPRTDSRYIEDPELTRAAFAMTKPQERLTVSAIVGPPTPFAVETRTINGMMQLALARSCQWNTPTGAVVADPAVRIAWLVESFGSRGSLETVCDSDYAPEVTRIAMAIQRSLGIACLDTSTLADSLGEPGLQPACEAREIDGPMQTALPRCPSDDDCFDLVDDPQQCGGLRVVVDRKTPASPSARVDVFCEAR